MIQKLDYKRRKIQENKNIYNHPFFKLIDLNSDIDNNDSLESGFLKSLSLINFMCHDSLELEFGPQINFIIGRNGSGKSAILTAILVGLGAKASETNRGNNIKDFIKDGKSFAKITIVFSNNGKNSFEKKRYGDSIIVERKIQRQGLNSYSIKSEDGKVITNKKNDLDEILYKFNITIDNPLVFLSQEKAKDFLVRTSDHVKYNYFMTGTLLNEILENFNSVSKNISDLKTKINQTKEYTNFVINKYNDIVKIYNKHKQSDKLRNDLALTYGKIYWYNVIDFEKKIIKYETNISMFEKEIIDIEEKLKQNILNLKNANDENDLINDEHIIFLKEYEKEKKCYEKIKSNKITSKSLITQLKNELTENTKVISLYENKIKEIEKLVEKQDNKSKESKDNNEESFKNKLIIFKSEINTLNDKKNSLRKFLNDLEDKNITEKKNIQSEIKNIQNSIQITKKKKEDVEKSQKNKYIAWGPDMIDILNRIDEFKNWYFKPIGPIGYFIEIKKEYYLWMDLVNTILQKTLDSFIVSNEHDRKILDSIFKKFKVQKSIIIRKNEIFDYENGKVKNLTTFLDIMNVKDKNVLYTLIDKNRIEKCVITTDRSKATDYLNQKNVENVFVLLNNSGQRFNGNQSIGYKIDPIYFLNAMHKFYNQSVFSDEILKKIKIQFTDENEKLQKLISNLHHQTSNILIIQKDKKDELKKIEEKIAFINSEIFEIENRFNQNDSIFEMENLKSQILDYKKQISLNKSLFISLFDDQEKEKKKYQDLKNNLSNLETNLKEKEYLKNNLEKKIEDLKIKIISFEDEIKLLHSEKQKLNLDINLAKGKIKIGKKKLVPLIIEAESKCKRSEISISESDTQESISLEYSELQIQILDAEKKIEMSLDETQIQLLKFRKIKEKSVKNLENLNSIFTELQNELTVRFNFLNLTIFSIIDQACQTFQNALELRGLKGTLKFNFSAKKLTLLVMTQNENNQRVVSSLSGGEKSYSQIALILSIWKIANSRVRGLDEFDVFMDSVNRSISIKLLLNEVKYHSGSQSIFITPQDITSIKDLKNNKIKIFKIDK